MALATSRDFKNWTDYGLIFQSDDLDQQLGVENIKARLADASLRLPFHNNPKVYRVDVYNMGAFYYDGIYIGLPAMYHATGPVPNYPNTDGFHLVQLAMSRDLKNWKRLGDRRPFIGPSAPTTLRKSCRRPRRWCATMNFGFTTQASNTAPVTTTSATSPKVNTCVNPGWIQMMAPFASLCCGSMGLSRWMPVGREAELGRSSSACRRGNYS